MSANRKNSSVKKTKVKQIGAEVRNDPLIKPEKGIPIPELKGTGRNQVYPFRTMEVDESFQLRGSRQNAYSITSVYNRVLAPKRFVIRCLEDGTYRCWRVK